MCPPASPSDGLDDRIALRLRQRRRELALDPRILDIVIGESQGTVAKFEAGVRRIGPAQLFRLCEALDVSIEYFFDEHATVDGSEPEEAPEPDPHMLTEAERFTRTFALLPDRRVRRRLLNLIKTIADDGMEDEHEA